MHSLVRQRHTSMMHLRYSTLRGRPVCDNLVANVTALSIRLNGCHSRGWTRYVTLRAPRTPALAQVEAMHCVEQQMCAIATGYEPRKLSVYFAIDGLLINALAH